MPRLDRRRRHKLLIAIRYLVANDALERGYQSLLAEHFQVSRQHVSQVVTRERKRRELRAKKMTPSAP